MLANNYPCIVFSILHTAGIVINVWKFFLTIGEPKKKVV